MGRNKSPIRSTRVPAYWLTVACVALQLGWPAAPADSSTSTGEGSRATVIDYCLSNVLVGYTLLWEVRHAPTGEPG